MFHKKDYLMIAEVIGKLDLIGVNAIAKSELVEELAKNFEKDNPRFDRLTFYEACFPEVMGGENADSLGHTGEKPVL